MRQIAVLSAALVVSLVWSYSTWTSDTEEGSDADEIVYVYQTSETDLQKVRWESKDLKVAVEKRKDDRGEYLWVETEEVKKKAPSTLEKPPGHPETDGDEPAEEKPADGSAAPEVPTEVKTSRFVASTQGMEMWKSFAPLQALRELTVTTEERASFGLDNATDPVTIEVTASRGATKLAVGGETYGSKDRYVESGGKVYLVDDATLRPLQYAASRLVERSLFPLAEADIDKVEVTLGGGKAITWSHENKADAAAAFWARSTDPSKKDESGGTWLDKLFKLKLREYVDRSTVTATLEPVVTFTVYGKNEIWPVTILKTTGSGKTEWYADAAYNRSLVTLTDSLVRNVVDDISGL
jgi:Domain of unknown function (DUF4340)